MSLARPAQRLQPTGQARTAYTTLEIRYVAVSRIICTRVRQARREGSKRADPSIPICVMTSRIGDQESSQRRNSA
eukprot:scaffold528727_cov38-Prasinocladus_malaysianus.AAC.1